MSEKKFGCSFPFLTPFVKRKYIHKTLSSINLLFFLQAEVVLSGMRKLFTSRQLKDERSCLKADNSNCMKFIDEIRAVVCCCCKLKM